MGLGGGTSHRGFLPNCTTDFIYSVICEELGLVGGMCVLILFVLLMWQGFRIAWTSENAFGALLAAGLTLVIGVQALLHVGVAIGVLPCTGIPLPLISYGGTALVCQLGSIGLLMSVARH